MQFKIRDTFICFVEDAAEHNNMEINNFFLARD